MTKGREMDDFVLKISEIADREPPAVRAGEEHVVDQWRRALLWDALARYKRGEDQWT